MNLEVEPLVLCALALHVLIAHALRVLYARARLWLCGLARLCVFFRLLVACAVVLLSSSVHLLAPVSSFLVARSGLGALP